jgi:hypothetical protein
MTTETEPKIDDVFNLATHNGIITVENTTRGTHRTFRIRTQKKDAKFAPGERILSLLTGPDNTRSYTQIAFVKDDGSIQLWGRFQQYDRLIRVLLEPDYYRTIGFAYHYEGQCRVCNRLLTTPESIRSGIGPVCDGRE